MKNVRGFTVLILSVILSSTAYAVPGSLTYQGRIKNSDGQSLEFNGVKFEFSVTNPTGSCTIYKETSAAVDMRNSGGVFDVPIGTGVKNFPVNPGFKLLDAFENNGSYTCEGGGTYSPLVDDKRLLRVQFHDGSGWKLITPDNEIRAVPYAGHAKIAQIAQKLGSNVASDFVLISNVPLCGAGQYLRHVAPLGTFECTSPTVTGTNVVGNITGSSAGFTGNLSGDVSGTQSATSVNKIKGVTLDMTGIAPGKVLKYNGTSWAPADDDGTTGALTGLTGDVTSTGSPTATVTLNNDSVSTNKIADGAITSAKIANGAIVDANISGSANIADTKLATITTAGKVSGSAITSGTIGGSTSVNTSGTVTSTAVSATTVSTNTLQIYKTGNGNKVSITVPSSLSPDYSLQLPGDAGNPGQILSTNGSGVLSWIDPSSGTVTSVTATPPLASTGGSTPVLSLNNSGVAAGDYTKVTVSTKGLVTAGASLIAADIPNLAGDVSSTSGTSNTKVEKIQGISVTATTPLTGQVLIYGGANWAPQYFGMGQLRSTVTGTTQVPASCSTADKTLTWSAITDSFVCTAISITNTQVTGLGTASTKNFGTAAGNLVELDGAGKIPTSLLPSSAGNILDGGNSTGATVSIGTNDANSLAFKTNSTEKMTLTSSGNIGIGTTSPGSALQIGPTGANSNVTIDYLGTASTLKLRYNASDRIVLSSDGGQSFSSNGVSNHGAIRLGDGGTSFSYITAGAGNALLLNSVSGNVGIGTTNPQAKLDVNGAIRATSICDENGANCKTISGGWGPGGSVTNVATGTGLTGGPITGSGTISIAAGGVGVTELASNAVTTVKIADGNVTGAKLETLAGLVGATYGSATSVPAITVDTKGRITAIATNNITGLLPTASGVSGKYLKSDGTNWSGQDVKFSDIKNSVGATAFNTSSCAANQTVKWSSLTDMFECQNIGSLDAATITTGMINSSLLPAGASMWQDGGAGKIYYSSGNVGIGTSSPSSKLEVNSNSTNALKITGTSTNSTGLSISNSDTGANTWNLFSAGSSSTLPVGAFGIWDAGAGTNRLAILKSGNVGIGTTTPIYLLDVRNSTSSPAHFTNGNTDGGLYLTSTASSSSGWISGGASHDGTNWVAKGTTAQIIGGDSGVIRMFTDSSLTANSAYTPTERMRIDSSGNVGIGTISPTSKLHISNGDSSIVTIGPNATYNASLLVGATNANMASAGKAQVVTSNGNLHIDAATSSNVYINHFTPGNTIMNTSGGNVGIGIANPGHKLEVISNVGGIRGYTASGGTHYGVYGDSAGGYWGGIGRSDGYAFVGVGQVWATGAGNFNQSDRRYKENIHNLDHSIETIMKLRPVTYRWKKESQAFISTGSNLQYGLIAQEVKEAIPEIVTLNKRPPFSPRQDGSKTLDEKIGESYGVEYTKIIPFLIGSVQEIWKTVSSFMKEQIQINSEVKRELAAIKEENAQLKALLCKDHPTAEVCKSKD